MDHSTTTAGQSTTMGMMIPYLHFAGGDYFLFKAWKPSSSAAIAGACLGLVVLAVLERWLAATRAVFAMQWKQKALRLAAARDQSVSAVSTSLNQDADSSEGASKAETDVQEIVREPLTGPPRSTTRLTRTRTIPPFIYAHDIPRGALFSIQMLLAYLMMLAVMTFQAAYLISILVGLGIGEIFFGRLAVQAHVH